MSFINKIKEHFSPQQEESAPKEVALIIARHDNAPTQDISAYGAAYAYLTGKLLCDQAEVPYPEHIFYSPVSRARNTAKMHQLAMKLNDLYIPSMSYDAGFHEHASNQKTEQALEDAVLYAKSQNMQTVEIVGHEPTVAKILHKLGASAPTFGYGGCAVLKAKSWDDMLAGKITDVYCSESSKDFAVKALGKEQAELLDDLMYRGTTGMLDLSNVADRVQKQIKKACTWIDAHEAGKPTEEKYSPAEFLEVLDAYKFWAANSMTALGIAPDEKGPFQSNIQKLLFGQDEYFNQKFLAEFHLRSDERMDDSESTQPYALFNAVAKMVAQRNGAGDKVNAELEKEAEQMEDFPLYRDIIAAGEERILDGDKEVKDTKKASYRVTQKEQAEHDKIADIVRDFKTNQR